MYSPNAFFNKKSNKPFLYGKGLFDFLLKKALGEYMQSPDIALITSNKRGQLEAPSAIVATCTGALLITMQESGPDATIKPGDVVMCRFLIKKHVSARLSAAILMLSNKENKYERDTPNGIARPTNLLRLPYILWLNPIPIGRRKRKRI